MLEAIKEIKLKEALDKAKEDGQQCAVHDVAQDAAQDIENYVGNEEELL